MRSISQREQDYFNNNSQGDFIEVTVVLTSATGDYSYYINAKSSNTNGFLSS